MSDHHPLRQDTNFYVFNRLQRKKFISDREAPNDKKRIVTNQTLHMDMEDEKGNDEKLLAIVDSEPDFHHVRTIDDIAKHKFAEISEFFKTYKKRLKTRNGQKCKNRKRKKEKES